MFGYQKRKVCIVGVFCRIFIAVAVYCDDSIGVLINHNTSRVHTESTDHILKLLGSVNDLALVKLIGQTAEHLCRKLHTDTDIHTVGKCGDLKICTYSLHPFTSASSRGDDAVSSLVTLITYNNCIAVFCFLHFVNGRVKIEIYMGFHLFIEILKYYIVDIRSQVADRCIQKMQAVLKTELTDLTVCGGIKPGSLSTMHQIQFIYIFHQFCGCILADMLIQRSAKLIGDIIFSIGESACTAKSFHDRTCFTVDTGFYFLSVNRTFSFFQRMAGFKNRDLFLRIIIHQLIGCKDSSRTCSYDQYVIFHK